MENLFMGGGFNIINFLLLLLFGYTYKSPYLLITEGLYMTGVWKILEKSGIPGWWALIPGAREYQLARCAGREPEGRPLSVAAFITRVLRVLGLLPLLALKGAMGSNAGLVIIDGIELAFMMIVLVYSVRVYSGLIRIYGRRKRWMWVWILLDWVAALVWGFHKDYQPSRKVQDINAELKKMAFQGSADVMDEGLTVNLAERSVREFFHKKILLRDIHMSIPSGHMVLLLGGSGAGKTTYINAVNGYEKAKAEVVLNGRNMYRQYKEMQYEVGFVPQQEMMSGKDTVLYTLLDAAKLRLPKDVPASVRRQRVNEVMDIFGLKPVQNNLEEKLSGGQKKRLSIAMEFLSNPSLFILDEPDSGLDGVMARELFVQLRKIADTGKIVIVITHTPDRVIDLFDDVIVLAKDSARTGRLAWYGSIEEARIFFGRDKMEEIVKAVNREEEGGDGLADEYIRKYGEVQHG